MSIDNHNLKLKLAWQTAFELRTCPDSETLHAPEPDDNLNKHLAICHVCREKREMNQNEQNAWKSLRGKFTALAMKPGIGTDKQVGQIWTINKKFGGWREDSRFIRPPSVLLLEKVDGTSGWRVAQLFGDKQMMGSGDVALDNQYGFAEAWNCYSMKDDRLDKCLGGVKPNALQDVLAASASAHMPAQEGSILSFFRSMEIEVGSVVAVPAVAELAEEWEVVTMGAALPQQEFIKGIFLKVTTAGEIALTMAHEALLNVRNAMRIGSLEAMAPARSVELLPSEQTPSAEFLEFIDKMKEQNVPFVPVDIYTADDSTYIPVFKTTTAESQPDLIIAYHSTIIDSKRIFIECWETDHSVIVIKDFWISKSKIQMADRLFEMAITDGIVKIDILPE